MPHPLSRRLPLLTAAALAATFALAPTAWAQDASIGAGLGASTLDDSGSTHWCPTLRLDATLSLAGPLSGGAYLQVVGSELPLANPNLGAGIFLRVAPTIPFLGALRPIGEASLGRVSLPSETQGSADAWSAALGAGLAVELAPAVELEGRVHHAWLIGLDDAAGLGASSWTLTAGLRIGL